MKPPPLQGEGWGGDGVPARRGGVEETHPHLNPPLEGEDFRAKPPPLKGRTPRQEAFDRCPTPHPCSSNWAPKNCRSRRCPGWRRRCSKASSKIGRAHVRTPVPKA